MSDRTDPVHCPKCGDVLREDGGRLRCEAGEMELSQVVATEIRAMPPTVDPAEAVHRPGSSRRIGGRWFCPRDAALMVEEDGRISCPRCGRTLSGVLIYDLIELHPHRPEL